MAICNFDLFLKTKDSKHGICLLLSSQYSELRLRGLNYPVMTQCCTSIAHHSTREERDKYI